jgi:4-aminobutyrate aminotransferase
LRRPDGSPAEFEAEQIMYSALSMGLSFKVTTGSTLALTPPLNILEEHLEGAVRILDRCFSELNHEHKEQPLK